jgi:hypothetical protein
MVIDPEFKKALELLPGKEKDKLILRLLRRDTILANQLYFKLVSTDSVEERREQVKKGIIENVAKATEHYVSPGYLLIDIRDMSGRITEHVSITKDKLGEITLNCLMLRLILEQNNKRVADEESYNASTFSVYIVSRLFKILLLIQKQHEDLHLEFRADIETIGKLLGQNPLLMKTAIYHGLDVNWLIRFKIPENIVEIHKDLRANGYLK